MPSRLLKTVSVTASRSRPSTAAPGLPAGAGASACSPSSQSTAPRSSPRRAPPPWKVGVADYRFRRRYLERQPPAPLTLRQGDPLIRALTYYRHVIAQKIQAVPP